MGTGTTFDNGLVKRLDQIFHAGFHVKNLLLRSADVRSQMPRYGKHNCGWDKVFSIELKPGTTSLISVC